MQNFTVVSQLTGRTITLRINLKPRTIPHDVFKKLSIKEKKYIMHLMRACDLYEYDWQVKSVHGVDADNFMFVPLDWKEMGIDINRAYDLSAMVYPPFCYYLK